MQHAILLGEYELSIDEKHRLLIPSEVRRSLQPERDGEFFYLTIGTNRKPWLYPQRIYESMVTRAEEQQDITPDDDDLAFDQIYFAMASRVEWDKQGRILMPEKTLRRTSIDREITMIGARNHLEIWNRTEWENQFETNFERGLKKRRPTQPLANQAQASD